MAVTGRVAAPAQARIARRIRNVVEPIAGCSIFSPEAHQEYTQLGLPSSEIFHAGVHMLHFETYVMTRSACLGPAPAEVVAAAFAVFHPAEVVSAVKRWRGSTTPEVLQQARQRGAVAALRRALGEPTSEVERAVELLQQATSVLRLEGRPLFAGLRSLGYVGEPLADLWRAADLFREHRGDSHISSWTARGLDAAQSCLLNDMAQGLPIKSYVRTRGWSEAELDDAVEKLARRGLVDEGGLTEVGRAFRDNLEDHTDAQQHVAVEALKDDVTELLTLLTPISEAIRREGGYPGREFVEGLRDWA